MRFPRGPVLGGVIYMVVGLLCLAMPFSPLSLVPQGIASEAVGQETGAGVPATSTEDAAGESPFDELVFFCTNCKHEVPEQLGAGTNCPNCGAYFRSATNADGSESAVEPPGQGLLRSTRFWGCVLLVLIFAGDYAYKRWRRQSEA